MQPGDEVLFMVWSNLALRQYQISGKILMINPDGTVKVRSSSGLITQDVHPRNLTTINGGSDLNRTVATA